MTGPVVVQHPRDCVMHRLRRRGPGEGEPRVHGGSILGFGSAGLDGLPPALDSQRGSSVEYRLGIGGSILQG